MTTRVGSALALALVFASAAQAQVISIKTVPIAQSGQFDIFPSQNAGMANVSLALPDTLLDPFSNPAKGARVGSGRFFGSPALYHVTGNAGAGRTLPLGALASLGRWFGGAFGAVQEVDASGVAQANQFQFPTRQLPIGEETHGNAFAFAMLGKTLPGNVSLAGSIFWSGLRAVDGVDMLYAGSQSVTQRGHAGDFRLGLLKEWAGGRSLEALAVHNRFEMAHEVVFQDLIWNPATQSLTQQTRNEHNLDYTYTTGLHVTFQQPIAETGWRVGTLLTTNRMSHPKLPEFDVQSVGIIAIPWDPGTSYAFNVGAGLSRASAGARFGFDLIYEPIWSHTWGEAPSPIATNDGGIIPAGGKTIDNHFRFQNWIARIGTNRDLGLGHTGNAVALQVGLMVHSIGYTMVQWDNVQGRGRSQAERWAEWAPTWGLTLRFPDLELRYQGQVTNGTGRPGVVPNVRFGVADAAVAGPSNSILVAPGGPLTLGAVKMFTHQISISVPLAVKRGASQ